MKRIVVFFAIILVVVSGVFAQQTMQDPAKPASVSVGAEPVKPVEKQVVKTSVPVQVPIVKEKVDVSFFLDDGTEQGLKADPKDFTLYILRLVGDKVTGGQAGLVEGDNISSFEISANGLYIVGAYSKEYKTWLTEKSFWVELSTQKGKYSTRGQNFTQDRNNNLQFFVWFKDGVFEPYKP